VTQGERSGLVRAIGSWSLTGLVVNSVIGSVIFGLPSVVAALRGAASPFAVLLAGAAIAVIIACYAEVASQFARTGGTYLYAREAFGRFAGVQVGWFALLVRVAGSAAAANLLVIYLGEFWPDVTRAFPKFLTLTLFVALLATLNYRGVRTGTLVSNVFVIGKLLPLSLIILVGSFYLMLSNRGVHLALPRAGAETWLQATLLFSAAYGGFETALIPMSKAKEPRRDVAFALFASLITVTIIYTAVQWVVVRVLPDPVHSARPIADAARILMGQSGAALMAVGALFSVFGLLSANMLAVPRALVALAEGGHFPLLFAAVHRKFRTPHVSIVVFAILTWLLALFGSFAWNVTLSAVARLFYYGLVCAAVPVLRRKQPEAACFRLPGGKFFAAVGVAICVVLATGVDFSKSLILAATFSIAMVNWLFVRRGTVGASLAPPEAGSE